MRRHPIDLPEDVPRHIEEVNWRKVDLHEKLKRY
jgi:hypothetical protein